MLRKNSFCSVLFMAQLILSGAAIANDDNMILHCQTTEKISSTFWTHDMEAPSQFNKSSSFNFNIIISHLDDADYKLEIDPERDFFHQKSPDSHGDEYKFSNGRCDDGYFKEILPNQECSAKLAVEQNFIRASKKTFRTSNNRIWEENEVIEINRIDGKINWSNEFKAKALHPDAGDSKDATHRLTQRDGKCEKTRRSF